MKNLTLKQYLFTQPGPREENPTDKIYLELANRLLQIWDGSGLLPEVPDELRQAVVLGIIGYYISKIYEEVKGRPRYIITDTCGDEEK